MATRCGCGAGDRGQNSCQPTHQAAAATLFFVTAHNIPVSTTHTITGCIVGVGSIHRLSAVRWGVAGRVVWAWLLTIPGAALVAALLYSIVSVF